MNVVLCIFNKNNILKCSNGIRNRAQNTIALHIQRTYAYYKYAQKINTIKLQNYQV